MNLFFLLGYMNTEEILNKEVRYPEAKHSHMNKSGDVVINIVKDVGNEVSHIVKEDIAPVVGGLVKEAIGKIHKDLDNLARYKDTCITYEEIHSAIQANYEDVDIRKAECIFECKKIHKDEMDRFLKEGGHVKPVTVEDIKRLRPDIASCCYIGSVDVKDFVRFTIPMSVSVI